MLHNEDDTLHRKLGEGPRPCFDAYTEFYGKASALPILFGSKYVHTYNERERKESNTPPHDQSTAQP